MKEIPIWQKSNLSLEETAAYSDFIINSTHMMCRSGRISKRVQVLCDALLLHPVLVLKKSKMAVGSMEIGGFFHAAKNMSEKCSRILEILTAASCSLHIPEWMRKSFLGHCKQLWPGIVRPVVYAKG